MWQRIRGQARAVAALRRMVASGRASHAYLFTGQPGVGRRLAARALAATLMCQAPDAPCERCESCRRMECGTHPDFHLLEPDGASIRIEQVRQLQRDAALKPFAGSCKVYVIDPAEAMTEEAQNCLLKVLEEPAPATYFVLISAQPDALLATVRSRCQVVRFANLPASVIRDVLVERGWDEAAAAVAAALADGSLGRALAMAPAELAERRDRVVGWLQRLRREGDPAVLAVGAQLESARDDIESILELAAAWYRDALAVRRGAGPELLVNRDRLAELQEEAGAWREEGLAAALAEVVRARRHVRANVQFRLAVDLLLMKLRRHMRG